MGFQDEMMAALIGRSLGLGPEWTVARVKIGGAGREVGGATRLRLFAEMPKVEADGTLDELLPDLMPWSDAVPDWCRSKSGAGIFADDPVVDVDPTDYDED